MQLVSTQLHADRFLYFTGTGWGGFVAGPKASSFFPHLPVILPWSLMNYKNEQKLAHHPIKKTHFKLKTIYMGHTLQKEA